MQRVRASAAALMVAAAILSGCSAAPPPTAPPSATAPAVTTAPDGGVLLRDLGFAHAPQGFSLPATTVVSDRVDAANNITAVLSQPSGEEIADYLRQHLPAMGFTITGDANGSLLFESPTHDGAFTVTDDLAAVTLRTDRG